LLDINNSADIKIWITSGFYRWYACSIRPVTKKEDQNSLIEKIEKGNYLEVIVNDKYHIPLSQNNFYYLVKDIIGD